MIPDNPSESFPDLTNDPLAIVPPFAFEGLSARIFPLRASLTALQRVCDGYLNFMPEAVGRFRAMSSYVYLMALDYGKLSELLSNIGWFAQKEVFFCFPVQWFKVVDGRWVFHDWAMITPFIYVDDDMSVPMGRTVYGWPKMLGRLTPSLGAWMDDPRAPVQAAKLSTMVFPKLYEGARLELRTLLEIERGAPPTNLEFPWNTRAPFAPWMVQANVARNLSGMSRDMLGLMGGLAGYPAHPGATPFNYSLMLGALARMLSPTGGGLVTNTLNLKQFRDAESPDDYCYQGLTNGRMRTTALRDVGVLGEERIVAGDLSGGYRIKVHEWPSIPIVDTLGLEVERRWQGDGPRVAELTPVMPFWYKVDMEYFQGQNVAWRTDDCVWRDDTGAPLPGEESERRTARAGRINSVVGSSALDALAGPFQFSGTEIRVLPLLAMREKLASFLDSYVNTLVPKGEDGEPEARLSLWAAEASEVPSYGLSFHEDVPVGPFAYVYLTASSFESVTSKSNNIGDWAKYEVSFLVPVKWERRVDGGWEVQGVGLLPAYTLVDDTTAAVARSEVIGIPTLRAGFERPHSAWMSERGSDPDAPQRLLRVSAEVMPAMGEGRQAKFYTVLDISDGDASIDEESRLEDRDAKERDTKVVSDRWAAILRQELMRKKESKRALGWRLMKSARALALEMLGNRVPFQLFTLKQFRDVIDPRKACYQAVLRIARTLEEVLDVREMEQVIRVRIHDFPTLPIVESLGILGKSTQGDTAGVIYTTQAIRPFYLRVTMNEALGDRLLSRAGQLPWKFDTERLPSILTESAPIDVTGLAEKQQDVADPRRVGRVADKWECDEPPGSYLGKITHGQAAEVVAKVDPQMIVESLLSREWGNWGEDTRWRRGLAELETAYKLTLTGVSDDWVLETENAFFRGLYQSLGQRPGQPDVGAAEDMIARLGRFTKLRLDMEKRWSALVDLGLERQFGLTGDLTHLLPNGAQLREDVIRLLRALGAIRFLNERNDVVTVGPVPDDTQGRLGELLGTIRPCIMERIRAIPVECRSVTDADGKVTKERFVDPDCVEYKALIEEGWRLRDGLRDAVGLAGDTCDLQRDAVLRKLSRASQKPDFCVNRSVVGDHADRLFPAAESWDEQWYYGPDGAGPRGPGGGAPPDAGPVIPPASRG